MDQAPDPFEPESVRRMRATAEQLRARQARALETVRHTEELLRQSQALIDGARERIAALSLLLPHGRDDDPTR